MKKSIRLFTFMLAAVLAACAFAGCGGNGQPANPTPDANEVLGSPNIYNELLNASSAQFLRINSDGQQNGEPIVIRDEETFKTEVLHLFRALRPVRMRRRHIMRSSFKSTSLLLQNSMFQADPQASNSAE